MSDSISAEMSAPETPAPEQQVKKVSETKESAPKHAHKSIKSTIVAKTPSALDTQDKPAPPEEAVVRSALPSIADKSESDGGAQKTHADLQAVTRILQSTASESDSESEFTSMDVTEDEWEVDSSDDSSYDEFAVKKSAVRNLGQDSGGIQPGNHPFQKDVQDMKAQALEEGDTAVSKLPSDFFSAKIDNPVDKTVNLSGMFAGSAKTKGDPSAQLPKTKLASAGLVRGFGGRGKPPQLQGEAEKVAQQLFARQQEKINQELAQQMPLPDPAHVLDNFNYSRGVPAVPSGVAPSGVAPSGGAPSGYTPVNSSNSLTSTLPVFIQNQSSQDACGSASNARLDALERKLDAIVQHLGGQQAQQAHQPGAQPNPLMQSVQTNPLVPQQFVQPVVLPPQVCQTQPIYAQSYPLPGYHAPQHQPYAPQYQPYAPNYQLYALGMQLSALQQQFARMSCGWPF